LGFKVFFDGLRDQSFRNPAESPFGRFVRENDDHAFYDVGFAREASRDLILNEGTDFVPELLAEFPTHSFLHSSFCC
jgi:hypothetical protein